MALAHETSIHKATQDLHAKVLLFTKNCPREYKHGIARDMSVYCQRVISLIYLTNISRDNNVRITYLLEVLERVHLINSLFKAAVDLKILSPAQFGQLAQLTTSVSKQATAWGKSIST